MTSPSSTPNLTAVPGAGTAHEDRPLTPASAPTGAGRIGAVGPVLAVLLLAVAVVLGREALLAWGALSGSRWLAPAADGLDGLRRSAPVVLAAGIVAVVVGLWLLVSAFARRSRRALTLRGAGAGVTTSTRDLARLATATATGTGGVLKASSTASRRSLEVHAHATSADVRGWLEQSLDDLVGGLEPRPRVKLHLHTPRVGGKDGTR
ncbi:DUF6286 domain-containing protein [Kineococcus rhizosphaerae]|uniref:DUF6286 domain-containing protein n=1 Tax=Kineococcus rhizosphaerae TaxID=559628 RepID=A0A2T0R3E7_9ACTN|nr:DUF6286 domain-containing protein [Kineococcus rhizosphaerae]PRY14566.1 hypothetical protein CLV37_106124 [Kineococcus rhizosphaerae]